MHRNNCLHETETVNKLCGKNQLRSSITHECDMGVKDLPSVYSAYFSSLPGLLSKSTRQQKQWFLVIRSGREACLGFIHYDNFSADPALRTWVGLSPLT